MMPGKFTCDGDNVSPALKWSGVPAGTKSLAIVCDDPDAPRGTWTHWIRFNMPPQATSVPEAVPCQPTLPDGSVQLINDSGSQGYDGPCPPSGTHRYYFKVFALGEKLDLTPVANKNDFFSAIKGRILAQGSIMATYKR
jgi:Raf kinase inhibitor-like YbhB/YbcL family protein